MSVVLRCPNCGTTQATPGECEACHEAQVRYYCTNHEPGVWLAGPSCPQCDARLTPAAPIAAPPATIAADTAPRQPLWETLLKGAISARSVRRSAETIDHAPLAGARGWLLQLVRRLVLIGVVVVVAIVIAVYVFVRSLQ